MNSSYAGNVLDSNGKNLPGMVANVRFYSKVTYAFLLARNGFFGFQLAWPLGVIQTCRPHPFSLAFRKTPFFFSYLLGGTWVKWFVLPLLQFRVSPLQGCTVTPFLPVPSISLWALIQAAGFNYICRLMCSAAYTPGPCLPSVPGAWHPPSSQTSPLAYFSIVLSLSPTPTRFSTQLSEESS